MEFKERKLWLADLRTALVFVLIAGIAIAVSHFVLNPKYEELKEQISQVSVIARQITSTLDEADQYQLALNESGKKYANLVTEKDKYVEFLGTIAQENHLNINKMTVDDIMPSGTLNTMKTQIELQGNLYNVKNFVQQLYDSEMVSRINSFSYRLEAEDDDMSFQWMWRSIDDAQLVPWWSLDISDSGNGSGGSGGDEKLPLSADDMMKHGKALCYLEVEFIGTGG